MNLVDFLLARIAEDEAVAQAAIQPQYGQTGEWVTFEDRDHLSSTVVFARNGADKLGQACDTRLSWIGTSARDHIARHDPARVLAECEAKRRIVLRAAVWADHMDETLRLLTLPYADHPDYDEKWQP